MSKSTVRCKAVEGWRQTPELKEKKYFFFPVSWDIDGGGGPSDIRFLWYAYVPYSSIWYLKVLRQYGKMSEKDSI